MIEVSLKAQHPIEDEFYLINKEENLDWKHIPQIGSKTLLHGNGLPCKKATHYHECNCK